MEMQYTIAENATPDEAEQGRLLFAQTTDFLKGVVAMDGMPPADRMEAVSYTHLTLPTICSV